MKKIYLYTALIYPFILANARMLPTIAGYQSFFVMGWIPKNLIIIGGFAFFLIFFFAYGLRPSSIVPLRELLILTFLCVIGGLISGISLENLFQGFATFLAPMLVFATITGMSPLPINRDKIIKFYLIAGAINVPAALYGILILRNLGPEFNPDDAVNGFFTESHQLTIFFFFLSLLTLGLFLDRGKKKWLLASLSCILIAVMGLNEKAILLFFVLVPAFIVWKSSSRVRRIAALVFLPVVTFAAIFVTSEQGRSDLHLDIIEGISLSDIPIVKAYFDIPQIFVDRPEIAIVGAGFGNFGTTVAFSKVQRGEISPLANKYNAFSLLASLNLPDREYAQVSALNWSSTLFISFLIEVGIVGAFLFFRWYARLLRFYLQMCRRKSQSSGIAIAVAAYLVLTLAMCFVSTFNSFDDLTMILPVWVFAAVMTGQNIEEATQKLHE